PLARQQVIGHRLLSRRQLRVSEWLEAIAHKVEIWCARSLRHGSDHQESGACERKSDTHGDVLSFHFLIPASQLTTSVTGGASADDRLMLIRKRWPSAETSYGYLLFIFTRASNSGRPIPITSWGLAVFTCTTISLESAFK